MLENIKGIEERRTYIDSLSVDMTISVNVTFVFKSDEDINDKMLDYLKFSTLSEKEEFNDNIISTYLYLKGNLHKEVADSLKSNNFVGLTFNLFHFCTENEYCFNLVYKIVEEGFKFNKLICENFIEDKEMEFRKGMYGYDEYDIIRLSEMSDKFRTRICEIEKEEILKNIKEEDEDKGSGKRRRRI